MKLLFISPRYSGGIGGHANILATKLREYGYEVDIMKVPHIPIKNLKNPSFAILSSFKVMLTRSSYDIIHAFNLPSAFAMKFAKGKKKILAFFKGKKIKVELFNVESLDIELDNLVEGTYKEKYTFYRLVTKDPKEYYSVLENATW